MVCTMEAWEGSWLQLGPLWEVFHKTGLSQWALGWSCLMVVMYNGHATDSNRVTMQRLHCVNVIHAYMTSHAMLPNIACVHKRIEIEMEDGSKPLHKFTDLCREVIAEGNCSGLFRHTNSSFAHASVDRAQRPNR
jgi:hypothetical protein